MTGFLLNMYQFASITGDGSVVPEVSSDEFIARLMRLYKDIMKVLGAAIIPIVMVYSVFAILLFVIGSRSKTSNMKKAGLVMLACEFLGLFIYFSMPLFIGLMKHWSKIMNG